MKTERGRGEPGEIQTNRKRIGEKMGKDGEGEEKGRAKDEKGIRKCGEWKGKVWKKKWMKREEGEK